MPVSTATIKRDELIKEAYSRCGIDYPSVDRINSGAKTLNRILKEIDVEGRWLWTIAVPPSSMNLIPAQRSYGTAEALGSSIDTNILRLEWAEVVQGTSLRPLRIIYELEALSNIQREAVGGQPYYVYLATAALMSAQRMHFFPTPSTAQQVNYTFRRRLYDFTLPADNPDFPQDWDQRLIKRLAYELAPGLGVSAEDRMIMKEESKEAMDAGKAANAETPTPRPTRSQFF